MKRCCQQIGILLYRGGTLAWVRALGEFGIVMIFAYFPQGIPVKLYTNLQKWLLQCWSSFFVLPVIAGQLVVFGVGGNVLHVEAFIHKIDIGDNPQVVAPYI